MARNPQARAVQPPAGDDFYDENEGFEEPGDRRQEGQEGDALSEDASVNAGTEQETGGEEDLGADDDEFLEPEPPRSRGERRLQALQNENRRLTDELTEARRQPALSTQPQGPREETDAEFEARIQQLSIDEKMDERWRRRDRRDQQQQLYNHVQERLRQDVLEYDTYAKDNRRAVQLKNRVESEFQKRWRENRAKPRLEIYYEMLGRELETNGVLKQRERTSAQRRVDRNTVRPPQGGGSDVRQQRRQTDERTARARRLDGMQI